MIHEELDPETIIKARRKAIEESIHTASIDELKALGERLFPFMDNPWREIYFNFLQENADSPFCRAKTHDRVEIIYCPAKEKGMWFIRGSGMGPLRTNGVTILKETVAKLSLPR